VVPALLLLLPALLPSLLAPLPQVCALLDGGAAPHVTRIMLDNMVRRDPNSPGGVDTWLLQVRGGEGEEGEGEGCSRRGRGGGGGGRGLLQVRQGEGQRGYMAAAGEGGGGGQGFVETPSLLGDNSLPIALWMLI
jgi:hypothetical protein